jgi:galactokinase
VTSREKVLEELPEEREELLKIFANHCQPKKYGYKIRQTILYGIAECERSRLFGEMLEEQNFEKLGELINISHEGDRILRNNRVTNRRLDKLIKYLQEKDPVKREKSRLYQQPGGYEVSCKELDELVDLARSVKGVLGAGLVGAGLGGSIVVLVKKKSVPPLFETMRRKYYEPKRLPCGVEVCRPIKGAEILKL